MSRQPQNINSEDGGSCCTSSTGFQEAWEGVWRKGVYTGIGNNPDHEKGP